MRDKAASDRFTSDRARWSNHDITSDGRVVEECVGAADNDRRVVWYDERGRVAHEERPRRSPTSGERLRSA
jgi:hypothetical protein